MRRALAICGCALFTAGLGFAGGVFSRAIYGFDCYYFPASRGPCDSQVEEGYFRRGLLEGTVAGVALCGALHGSWLLVKRIRKP